jgi:two-component system sensor histidine kinase DegS
LGELAKWLNDTAGDLARLQEATLAEERARTLRERIIQVTTAQEEERRRISRDLHDGLGPSLAAICNRLRACQHIVRTEPEQPEKELEEMARGLRGHVREVRELIHELRPLALDQLGLAKAVEEQVSQFDQQTGIKASFNISGNVALNSFAEVTVFRVVQECLTNVQKHANAKQVDVQFKVTDTGLETTVRDNGNGFDARKVAGDGAGKSIGLLSMRERAELLGGSLSVQSSPDRGSEIILFIPTAGV